MFLPSFYNKHRVSEIYRVDYERIYSELSSKTVKRSSKTNSLVLIGCQNGHIAGNDKHISNIVEFIYRNMESIDDVFVSLVAHPYILISSPVFWADGANRTLKSVQEVTLQDFKDGKIKVNPKVSKNFPSDDPDSLDLAVESYLSSLEARGEKLLLKITPFPFGSIDFALVPVFEEAVYSHSVIHKKQPYINSLGQNPFAEYDSVFSPKVSEVFAGMKLMCSNNATLLKRISKYQNVVFAGLPKELLVASIEDFCERTNYQGTIYCDVENLSFMDNTKKGKTERNMQIINKRNNIITCNLSTLNL